MNINLIIKLARLANENPNENEANLAARKVCSLIKQADYKFNGSTIQSNINQSRTPRQDNSNTTTKSTNRPVDNPWDFSWFYEEINKPRNYSKGNPFKSGEPYYPFKEEENKKKEKPKRTLKCKTCKQDMETSFVGLAEIFECNNCSWSEYTRKKESTK